MECVQQNPMSLSKRMAFERIAVVDAVVDAAAGAEVHSMGGNTLGALSQVHVELLSTSMRWQRRPI